MNFTHKTTAGSWSQNPWESQQAAAVLKVPVCIELPNAWSLKGEPELHLLVVPQGQVDAVGHGHNMLFHESCVELVAPLLQLLGLLCSQSNQRLLLPTPAVDSHCLNVPWRSFLLKGSAVEGSGGVDVSVESFPELREEVQSPGSDDLHGLQDLRAPKCIEGVAVVEGASGMAL